MKIRAVTYAALFSISNSFGAVIYSPGHAYTSTPAKSFYTQTYNITNQSGLSEAYVSGETDADAYLASNPTHGGYTDNAAWVAGNLSGSAKITFVLNDPLAIQNVIIWNAATEAISGFELYSATDSNFQNYTFIGAYDVVRDGAAQVFDIPDTTFQYFFITVNVAGNRLGLGEIALIGVPEPSAAALASFGVIGLICCRRRLSRPS